MRPKKSPDLVYINRAGALWILKVKSATKLVLEQAFVSISFVGDSHVTIAKWIEAELHFELLGPLI